jgi:plastocyanin
MVTWLIRACIAVGATIVLIAAVGSRRAEEESAKTVAVVAGVPTPAEQPTPPPSPTREVESGRIVSRVTRETPAPYPTSTPIPDGMAIVSVVDFGYMPSVTRIHVGQTVVWRNGGRELHDVTGEDDWHSGPIEPTREYRHTFGFEGSFNFRCSVHPDMRGTIVVAP